MPTKAKNPAKRAINPLRLDPSRTSGLRRRFMADMAKRFRELRAALWELIATDDAFGLDPVERPKLFTRNAAKRRFEFKTSVGKLTEFKAWVQEQVDAGILVVDKKYEDEPWTAPYIDSAYRQGVVRGYTDANRLALSGDAKFYEGSKKQFLHDAFASPVARERVELLKTRTYERLRGITSDMSAQLGTILADGMAHGHSARKVAKAINDQVSGIEKKRALVLARTEIIHAHAEGQLDSMETMGIDEAEANVEWSTAGDSRVCPKCSDLSGQVFTIKQARGKLPRHPNCRCCWNPVVESSAIKGGTTVTTKQKTAAQKEALFDDSKKQPPIVEAILPTVFGHAPTGVLRWMGTEGFTFKEARATLDSLGVEASDATIRAQLLAGKKGERGAPAPLTDEQKAKLQELRKNPTPKPPTPPKPPPVVVLPPAEKIPPPPIPVKVEPTTKVTPIVEKNTPTKVPGMSYSGKYDPSDPYSEFGEQMRRKLAKERKDDDRDPKTYIAHGKEVSAFVDERMKVHEKKIQEKEKEKEALDLKLRTLESKYQAEYDRVMAEAKKAGTPWDKIPKVVKSEEHKELWDRRNKMGEELYDLKYNRGKLRAEETFKALSSIRDLGVKVRCETDFVQAPTWVGKSVKKTASKKELEACYEAMSHAGGKLPKDWLGSVLDVNTFYSKRGFFTQGNEEEDTDDIIALSGNSQLSLRSTAIHELTHKVAYNNTKFTRTEQQYFAERTRGETLKPIPGSGGKEVCLEDKLGHPYMGRVYEGDPKGKEIATMAAEEIFYGTRPEIYEKDRESYDFVLGMFTSL